MRLFASFIAEGLAMGDRVIYTYPDEEAAIVQKALQLNGIDVARYLEKGSLILKPHSKAYLRTGGELDKQGTIKLWTDLARETHRRGYRHWRELIDRGDLSFYNDWLSDFLDFINDPAWDQYDLGFPVIGKFLIELDAIKKTLDNRDAVEEFVRGFAKYMSAATVLIDMVEYADVFSKKINANHSLIEDKLTLMEFDPTTRYEDAVLDFINESMVNVKPVVVFTRKSSQLVSIARDHASITLCYLSIQPNSLTQDSDRNVRTLSLRDTSLILDTTTKLVQGSQGKRISLVFDGLSDMIIAGGLEKTYAFLFSLGELLAASKVTGLFLLNPLAHDEKQVSVIRNFFAVHLTHVKSYLRLVKASEHPQARSPTQVTI